MSSNPNKYSCQVICFILVLVMYIARKPVISFMTCCTYQRGNAKISKHGPSWTTKIRAVDVARFSKLKRKLLSLITRLKKGTNSSQKLCSDLQIYTTTKYNRRLSQTGLSPSLIFFIRNHKSPVPYSLSKAGQQNTEGVLIKWQMNW